MKSMVDQKLDLYGEEAARDYRSAEYIQVAPSHVTDQGDHGHGDQSRAARDGECERKEPVPLCEQVDEQQIKRGGSKVRRRKNDGIRLFEPYRKNGHDIKQDDRAGDIAGPSNTVVEFPVKHQCQYDRNQEDNGKDEQYAADVDGFFMTVRVGWIKCPSFRPYQIGMIDDRSAKRAFQFAFSKFYTAFHTIHPIYPL